MNRRIEQYEKINELIKDTLSCDYIKCIKFDDFTVEQLDLLAEEANKNNLLLTLRAEHSNVYQGVLVNLIKREEINSGFLECL